MHVACAVIIQRVHESKEDALVAHGSLSTLRKFYDKLRMECLRNIDEWGNVYWPHDYYGAIDYWSYDDWEYGEGCMVRSFPLQTFFDCSHRFRNTYSIRCTIDL